MDKRFCLLKQEYLIHVGCEWLFLTGFVFCLRSQRSKECPICWQLLVLMDPARYITCFNLPSLVVLCLFLLLIIFFYLCSQGLLAAVQCERRARTRNTSTIASPAVHYFRDDDDSENVSFELEIYI